MASDECATSVVAFKCGVGGTTYSVVKVAYAGAARARFAGGVRSSCVGTYAPRLAGHNQVDRIR